MHASQAEWDFESIARIPPGQVFGIVGFEFAGLMFVGFSIPMFDIYGEIP